MAVKTVWAIGHACGPEQDHDLSSKRASERAGYVRWLAARDCTDCWRSRRDTKAAAERQAAMAERRSEEVTRITAWETRASMPALTGSDRAADWARRVRWQLLADAFDHAGNTGPAGAEFAGTIEGAARKITSAPWWIDQRDTDPFDVAELIADAAANSALTSPENQY